MRIRIRTVFQVVELCHFDLREPCHFTIDGLFMHTPPLCARWDLSILLDVAPDVAAERLLIRDAAAPTARYRRGQELYFAACNPRSRATLVLPW
jgi:hypothetical protein